MRCSRTRSVQPLTAPAAACGFTRQPTAPGTRVPDPDVYRLLEVEYDKADLLEVNPPVGHLGGDPTRPLVGEGPDTITVSRVNVVSQIT
jgi:hypothetical protein